MAVVTSLGILLLAPMQHVLWGAEVVTGPVIYGDGQWAAFTPWKSGKGFQEPSLMPGGFQAQ